LQEALASIFSKRPQDFIAPVVNLSQGRCHQSSTGETGMLKTKTMTIRATFIALACAISVSAYAIADGSRRVDIPAGDLTTALQALAEQSGAEFIYSSDQLKGIHTGGVHGEYTTEKAATRLLEGTKLKLTVHQSGAMLIAYPMANSSQGTTQPAGGQGKLPNSKSESNDNLRVAQVDQGASPSPSSVEKSSAQYPQVNSGQGLEEIVVTAQKKTENLQDVPVPVTAISAQALVDQNEFRLQDYYSSIPGLSVTPADYRGDPIITIRGITTGGAFVNPTVGIVIDDVPFGTSSGITGSSPAVDIDPSDLVRVEVLRGPQGTLYGSSSIGGLLKYVTIDPTTDGLSGRVQAGTSSVYNGDGLGYNLNAAVNVPLSDTLAVRASAFTRQDPGYIDNVETGQNGVNKVDVDGCRLSALWRPSDVFSIKISALLQEIKAHGSPDVEPSLGDLKQSAVRGTGVDNKYTQAYSAIVSAKLGVIDLTALSGYSVNRISDYFDLSPLLGSGAAEPLFGVPGAPAFEDIKTTKYSEEIRLSAPIGQRFEWLFGGFYTHEDTPDVSGIFAADPSTGAIVGTLLSSDFIATTYEEVAAFTDLTVHITDRFNVQMGARESQNWQTYSETIVGQDEFFFGLPSPVVNPEERTRDNSFTYLVTPQFRFSPDLMLYARLASGFRAGGPNTTASVYHLPSQYAPDTTRNYEIGAKGDFLGDKLSYDASLYYIDWNDIQLQLATPIGALYYANASRAKSQGLEFSVESRPLPGLKISAWVTWSDAVLTEGFPSDTAAYGISGDRLPYSSRFSGNLSLNEEFSLASRVRGFVGGSVSYVGNRESVFTASPERQNLPAYTKADLRAGVKYESWTVNLFVDNVADQRGLLSGGLGAAVNPLAFTYIQPREAGLSVAKTF
jgi:iron complex outermembrane recepter protein